MIKSLRKGDRRPRPRRCFSRTRGTRGIPRIVFPGASDKRASSLQKGQRSRPGLYQSAAPLTHWCCPPLLSYPRLGLPRPRPRSAAAHLVPPARPLLIPLGARLPSASPGPAPATRPVIPRPQPSLPFYHLTPAGRSAPRAPFHPYPLVTFERPAATGGSALAAPHHSLGPRGALNDPPPRLHRYFPSLCVLARRPPPPCSCQ